MMTQETCLAAGGTWNEGQTCSAVGGSFDCPLYRVCCIGEECQIITEGDCEHLGGDWHPEWEACLRTNPCATPLPVSPESWGAIKAVYR